MVIFAVNYIQLQCIHVMYVYRCIYPTLTEVIYMQIHHDVVLNWSPEKIALQKQH